MSAAEATPQVVITTTYDMTQAVRLAVKAAQGNKKLDIEEITADGLRCTGEKGLEFSITVVPQNGGVKIGGAVASGDSKMYLKYCKDLMGLIQRTDSAAWMTVT